MICPFKTPESLTDLAEEASASFDAEFNAAGRFPNHDIEEIHYRIINAVQDATIQALVCSTCAENRNAPWCRSALQAL